MWGALPCLCPGNPCPAGTEAGGARQDGSLGSSEGQQLALIPVPRVSPWHREPALHTWPLVTSALTLSPCPAASESLLLSPHTSISSQFPVVCVGFLFVCFFFPKIALLQNLVVEKLLCSALVWVYLLVSCSETDRAWTSVFWSSWWSESWVIPWALPRNFQVSICF